MQGRIVTETLFESIYDMMHEGLMVPTQCVLLPELGNLLIIIRKDSLEVRENYRPSYNAIIGEQVEVPDLVCDQARRVIAERDTLNSMTADLRNWLDRETQPATSE